MASDEVGRRDLALRAFDRAALLREGRLGEIDARNLADEVERFGAGQADSLRDHLAALICRLSMWKDLPGARLPSWRATNRGAAR